MIMAYICSPSQPGVRRSIRIGVMHVVVLSKSTQGYCRVALVARCTVMDIRGCRFFGVALLCQTLATVSYCHVSIRPYLNFSPWERAASRRYHSCRTPPTKTASLGGSGRGSKRETLTAYATAANQYAHEQPSSLPLFPPVAAFRAPPADQYVPVSCARCGWAQVLPSCAYPGPARTWPLARLFYLPPPRPQAQLATCSTRPIFPRLDCVAVCAPSTC
jgi:hypothetical protein